MEDTSAYKILLVDDNAINLELLISLLEEKNWQIKVALDGRTALSMAQNDQFDLILLDVMMPDISGYEVCDELKANPDTQKVPVIFLTAKFDNDSVLEGFKRGAVDYVSKPFNSSELMLRVETHLELKSSKERVEKELKERKKMEMALRNSEEKHRNLFNFSSDAIFITDLEGNYIDVNSAAISRAGYTKEEFLKLNLMDVPLTHFSNRISDYFKILLEKGKNIYETEYVTKEGKVIPVEMNGKIIDYDHGKAILHISRDITERRQLQKKIVSTIIKTEEKERTRFAKDLHDGLGALLSSINIYINLIKSGNLDDGERENMIDAAKELVDEAIVSTKEIANNLRPNVLSHFGLMASIQSFCDKVNNTGIINIAFKSSEIKNRIDKDTEIIIFRIVNELINNTLKHSKAVNAEIDISIDEMDTEFILNYTDDGKGFDVDIALKEGGMGLNNIIGRINSLQGKCEIDSKPGKGIKVRISINLDNL